MKTWKLLVAAITRNAQTLRQISDVFFKNQSCRKQVLSVICNQI